MTKTSGKAPVNDPQPRFPLNGIEVGVILFGIKLLKQVNCLGRELVCMMWLINKARRG